MKAAVMEQFGEPLKVHADWSDPECGPRDVIVKVEACGICRSDYALWKGGLDWIGIVPQLPAVLGHEYSGVVEELGSDVTGFQRGDRVVSPFCHACGTCEFCTAGHQTVCANLQIPGMHYSGGYASHTKVANANVNLVKLPDAISFPEAAGMGCRFVTAYHGVVDQAGVRNGEWVAVFACGGVGLAAVNIASALGADVIAVPGATQNSHWLRGSVLGTPSPQAPTLQLRSWNLRAGERTSRWMRWAPPKRRSPRS